MLFKYCPPERLDILTNGFIRLTQPICFNDIFETQPIPENSLGTINISAEETSRLWDEFQRSPYLVASTDNEIEMAMHAESLLNIQKARFSTIAGIMSFSETHDNLLMWAHYGKDFQGYVFGFDPQDLPFAWREANPTFALRRVTYAKERPTLSLEEVVVDSPEGELLRKWFSTKADVWSYEKEWRIFKYLSNKDHVIPTETYPIHLVELDVKKLKCLILGPRSSKELKRAIRDICDENGIELFQHVKDATRYSLGTWDRQRMDYKEQTWKAAGMEDIGFKHGRSPAE